MNVLDLHIPTMWIRLSEELAAAGIFKIDRIGAHNLLRIFAQGSAFKIHQIGVGFCRIVGFGALWPTLDADYLEMGTIFVALSHRGRNFGQDIVQNLLERARRRGKSVIMVSKSAELGEIATKLGFTVCENVHCSEFAHVLGPGRKLDEGRIVYVYRASPQ